MVLLLIDSHISNLYTMKRIRNLSLRVTSSLYFHGLVIIKIKEQTKQKQDGAS